jgi:hypothetical protein
MGKHTGKKRWRKTDISDIQAALASDRILQEHLGAAPNNLKVVPSKSLFQIDKVGGAKDSKARTKQFYRDRKLKYEVELEPSHIVPPKVSQSQEDDPSKAKRTLQKVLLKMEKKQLVAAKPSKKIKAVIPAPRKVYDIWSAPAEPRKEIFARPFPQKALIRKPSELAAVELPQSDVSYNPSEESIEKVKKNLKQLEKKRRSENSRLERLIKPTRIRSVDEIQETLRPLTPKQLLQVKKTIKKSRTKASKPAKQIANANFSSKLNRTHRNTILKKRVRRQLLQKARREERRSKELDKVEEATRRTKRERQT